MPRTINPEKREARRQEILDAATRCFMAKGFHASSMQDICSEAGLSAGALYRYFASKDDIVIAIVEAERAAYAEFVLSLESTDDFLGTLAEVAASLIDEASTPGYAELGAEIYAEVLRNEGARAVALESERTVRNGLARAAKAAIERGELDRSWSTTGFTDVVMALLDGLDTRCAINDQVSARVLKKSVAKLLHAQRAPG